MKLKICQFCLGLSMAIGGAITLAPQNSLALSSWKRVQGNYEVPVRPEIKELAVFPLQNLRHRTRNGVREVKYTLPQELTARPIEVSFKGPAQPGTDLSGQNGYMLCRGPSCAVTYMNLNVREEEVKEFLESQGHRGDALTNRLEVFNIFLRSDPGGIVHFQ